jgi:hypothetical protein
VIGFLSASCVYLLEGVLSTGEFKKSSDYQVHGHENLLTSRMEESKGSAEVCRLNQ